MGVGRKTDEVASSERDLAVVFDRLSEEYSGAYIEHAANLANVHPGEQVLDVGTGTGQLARAIGARLGGSGKVLGVDVSEGMLAYGRARGRKLGLTPHIVKFARNDAEQLEVADSSVDVCTSLFLLRHLPRPDRAVAEMARVLRPGGRLVVGLSSAGPRVSFRATRYRAQRLRALVQERLGVALLAPQFILAMVEQHLSDEPRPDGAADAHELATNTGRRTEELLRAAGFEELVSSWLGFVHRVDDPQEFWEISMHFSRAARYRVLGARPAAAARLKEAFLAECDRVLDRGGALVYPHGSWFVRARRER